MDARILKPWLLDQDVIASCRIICPVSQSDLDTRLWIRRFLSVRTPPRKSEVLSGHSTTSAELAAAIQDLSRRPTPDVTGAIQHSMAALECYCREVALDPKSTLGALLSSRRDLFPAPMDDAVTKLWGFASEQGRHLREGRVPEYPEALLVVHIAAASILYLGHKLVASGV